MLRSLSIRDYVIVDEAEIEFDSGFTALTGETGAGKSILVEALALLLGDRADAALVRAGAERAELSAEFELSGLDEARSWLLENDLGAEECLLRRTIDSSGRSRAFINGRAATLQHLRDLGEKLVEIHGQHAHQALLKGETQRDLLDAFAGCSGLAQSVQSAWRDWSSARQKKLDFEKMPGNWRPSASISIGSCASFPLYSSTRRSGASLTPITRGSRTPLICSMAPSTL